MNQLSSLLTSNSDFFHNERQALIYLCLLKNGALGAEKIHQNTLLHREAIQRELLKMEKAGTIQFSKDGRNKKAKAVPLSVLQEMLDQKRERFDSLLKPLLDVEAKSGIRTTTTVLNGSHAYGLLQLRLIKLQPPETAIQVISTHPKDWVETMLESKKLYLFEKQRIAKKIPAELSCFSEYRGQVEYNNRNYFVDQPAYLKRKYRYVETLLSSPMQIQVWHSSITISIFESLPSTHIHIEDVHVTKAMRSYFKILWEIGSSQ